jgi:rhodanese-related sulfurtransferase
MDIKPDVAYEKLMDEEFDLVIDVVGLDIYDLGHLPGAVNFVWADGTLEEMIASLDVEGTYLVYCHTDPPSTASAQALIDAGITKTYRLEGNYAAWVDEGYPIET